MPELPEVETIVRTLKPHVLGKRIKSIQLLHAKSLHPLSLPLKSALDSTIHNVWRRGKMLVLDLEPRGILSASEIPQYLVVHLRMTGSLLPKKINAAPDKHTRCVFELQNDHNELQAIFFDDIRTFGKLLLANDSILQSWPFWRDLGPEPLEINSEILLQRLSCRRQLKAALLDQKVIAGIGNIYADEALFGAGLHPCRLASTLGPTDAEKLLASIQDVLTRSIEKCGSSIRDYRDANGNAGAFQNSFKVYGRGGKKCVLCRSILQKTKVGGRTTVYCSNCQK